MTEELYIDGQPVDLYSDKPLALNFKSNILGDISKITASNSYTIRLPRTIRNRTILDNPDTPAYDSRFPYRTHAAQYIRNGIAVIPNATAVMLQCGDDYEIALTWGVLQGLSAWIAAAPTLAELPDDGVAMVWDKTTIPTSYPTTAPYLFAAYDPGVTLDEQTKQQTNIHPCVKVGWLLSKIQQEYGFTLEIPSPQKEMIEQLAIPVMGDKANEKSWEAEGLNGTVSTVNREVILGGSLVIVNDPYTQSIDIWDPSTLTFKINRAKTFRVKIDLSVTTGGISPNGLLLGLYHDIDGKEPIVKPWRAQLSKSNKVHTWHIDETFTDLEIDTFALVIDQSNLAVHGGMHSIFVSRSEDKLTYPSAYPVIINLPDIKQVDFIKALCAMFGLFAIADLSNPANIKLVSPDTLIENKGQALDWSDKLVTEGNGPSQSTFSFGDYAQSNTLAYKDDDTVVGNYSGTLEVENTTLERNKTILTLPFAASDGNRIPQYKWSESDTPTIENVSVQPRIMQLINQDNLYALSFDGLGFQSLIEKFYPTYQKMIRRPLVIKESFTLDEHDLRTLDYTTPVYLRQYGRYYAIISIQTGSGDLCTCELLQLPSVEVEPIENQISINQSGQVVAEMPVTSTLSVTIEYYDRNSGQQLTAVLTIPDGDRQSEIWSQGITRILSVSPERDSIYKYTIKS